LGRHLGGQVGLGLAHQGQAAPGQFLTAQALARSSMSSDSSWPDESTVSRIASSSLEARPTRAATRRESVAGCSARALTLAVH
jgi:hypothetical protein